MTDATYTTTEAPPRARTRTAPRAAPPIEGTIISTTTEGTAARTIAALRPGGAEIGETVEAGSTPTRAILR